MGSCYSSQRSKDLEEAVDSNDGSATSPSLFNRLKSNNNKKKKKKRKNRDLIESLSDGKGDLSNVKENELHRIPGRLFVNGASDAACLFTQQGRKGTNQDAMLVWENFSTRKDTIFCGVFDGHGPYGHMVAKRVRDSLPLKLCAQWKANTNSEQNSCGAGSVDEETASVSMDDEWCDSLDVDENQKLPEMFLPLRQSFLKAFKLMDKDLKSHPTIDCFCSGTTAVTLIKQGQDLVIGNVGDSRAVLGTRDKDNSLIAVQLTVDLKPNLPREAARIQQCKGRVFALQDEPEVPRVWLPNNDSPGLAMARAFGDFCLKDYGLISVPDVSYRRLTEKDQFIVLATDGVWDVLSNKEVVDIVASAPTCATAARAVVDCAVRSWKLKYPTSKADDCACVCLFLDHPCPTNQAQEESSLEEKPQKSEFMVSTAVNEERTDGNLQSSDMGGNSDQTPVLQHSDTLRGPDEIVPVSETMEEKKLPERSQSTRSLAECISTAEDEEWSALEGVTRVNSLLNLPRFLSSDKRTGSWRKWL
ncbi:Protein phosphatase 2C (PP2C)-like domain [Macleaya cordata]|uniref:protein-serine/threonine phosphatase n=1 Tax=Macleaya cordata TaxID=56857 RepID=A0A200Q115_MACCD|nr:Protein phosphatase 2C (PP2C)-like domain [Macleaya cordata]